MQFSKIFQFLAIVGISSAASVSYDTGYDDAMRSLSAVACSDGSNGLITKGYTTQGSLPTTYIGSADSIAGWNSPNCGTCYQLSYNGRSIYLLAIDHAETGYNIALDAMNALTGGQAVQLGRIDATAAEVAPSNCGL